MNLQTTMPVFSYRLRLLSNLILPLTAFTFLCMQQMVQAHPQINITTTAASGGYCPFYLWWNTTGNASWPNYIFTELYDCNGNVLAGYPQEDPNIYYIPATQIHQPATPTGEEADTPPGACTVVISVSGQWNADSSNPEPVGAPGVCCPVAAIRAARNRKIRDHGYVLTVSSEKRFVSGQPTKRDVRISISNPTNNPAIMNFVYGVFKTSDPDNVNITPITYSDPSGNTHVFHRMNHGGNTRYIIPPSPLPTGGTISDSPTVLNDLRVDLSQGIAPTDYVYVDLFVIDNSDHQIQEPQRIQLQP